MLCKTCMAGQVVLANEHEIDPSGAGSATRQIERIYCRTDKSIIYMTGKIVLQCNRYESNVGKPPATPRPSSGGRLTESKD